jgi:hypothetical protein
MAVFRSLMTLLLVLLIPVRPAAAYSVLSHEEVVDMAWLTTIVPMLKARFPAMTDADLVTAHSYAYGGSVIQDIGYYPFGSTYYSDLLHYVRTGDFVSTLIRESQDPNEYAFALGALAHYCGDVYGHPAVNTATANEFPKDRARFGQVVTYNDDKVGHLRTEFGFDVVQVAHGRYSQQNYRDFIGFQVSKSLLEKAFLETYGIKMDSVMTHEDLAIATYRKSVSTIIPNMTAIAAKHYSKEIQAENPGFEKKKFIYRLRNTEFEKEYGKGYIHPGFGTRFLGFIVEHLPKIGPLKALKLSLPDANTQAIYIKSINTTVDNYKLNLAMVAPPQPIIPGTSLPAFPAAPAKPLDPAAVKAASAGQPPPPPPAKPTSGPQEPQQPKQSRQPRETQALPSAQQTKPITPATPLPSDVATPEPPSTNSAPDPLAGVQRAPDLAEVDLDTGKPSRFGEYRLADITYARLLDKLLKDKTPITPDIQQSFKDFYEGPRAEPAWYQKSPRDWTTLQADLTTFDALPPPPPPPTPQPTAPLAPAPH